MAKYFAKYKEQYIVCFQTKGELKKFIEKHNPSCAIDGDATAISETHADRAKSRTTDPKIYQRGAVRVWDYDAERVAESKRIVAKLNTALAERGISAAVASASVAEK